MDAKAKVETFDHSEFGMHLNANGHGDYVRIEDHETALAELREEVDKWHWHAESISEWGRQNLARAEAAEAKHATLLTGLEALAGEMEKDAGDIEIICWYRAACANYSEKLRTLASAGLEGK